MGYNLNTAISLRSEGIFDDVKGYNIPLDFMTSVQLASDSQFLYGWHYPGEVWMQAVIAREKGEIVTKNIWKNWNRQYRQYLRQIK